MPLIALAVGSRGLISQLLGPKFGGFLVYGSLGGKSVPGLPTLVSLKQVYQLEHINPDTKIFGLVSNPVGHSKGPILHNPAFRHTRFNGIYVPMLVDDVKEFFRTYSGTDFAGFRLLTIFYLFLAQRKHCDYEVIIIFLFNLIDDLFFDGFVV